MRTEPPRRQRAADGTAPGVTRRWLLQRLALAVAGFPAAKLARAFSRRAPRRDAQVPAIWIGHC